MGASWVVPRSLVLPRLGRLGWLCTVCSRCNDANQDECGNPKCALSFRLAGVWLTPTPGKRGTGSPRGGGGSGSKSAAESSAWRLYGRQRCQLPEAASPEPEKRLRDDAIPSPRSGKRRRTSAEAPVAPESPKSPVAERRQSSRFRASAVEPADEEAPEEAAAPARQPKVYRCARCGLPKRGHTCPALAADAEEDGNGSEETETETDADAESRADDAEEAEEGEETDTEAPPPLRLRIPRPFLYVEELNDDALPVKLTPAHAGLGDDVPSPRAGQSGRPLGAPPLLQHAIEGEQAWRDYWAVVADVLPNVPTRRLMNDEHAFTLVLTEKRGRKRVVVGGTTFRLLIEQEDGRRRLVLDILLLAFSSTGQGKGHGSSVVSALKKLAVAHAITHGVEEALLLTQADNLANTFWIKQGLSGCPGARSLVHSLEAWKRHDNPVYFGATPMVMQICRRLNSTKSRDILRR